LLKSSISWQKIRSLLSSPIIARPWNQLIFSTA